MSQIFIQFYQEYHIIYQMNIIRTGNPAAIGFDFFRDPQPINGRQVIL